MMTILEIAKAAAKNVGVAPFDAVVANTDQDALEIVQFSTDACREIARRVDWGQMQQSTTLTGDGTAKVHSLPSDFARLQQGTSVIYSSAPLRGGLSADEWNALPATAGTPRFFRLRGTEMEFWPYLADAATATVHYQSKNWNATANSAAWASDSDVPVIPDELVLLGVIWRWRRHKGMDYQDHQAEYEVALNDLASFDDRGRTP